MDAKIKAFWTKLNTDISELWQNNKIFVILFGVLLLIIKFRSILVDLLVSDSKDLLKSALQKNLTLNATEDTNNKAADDLVKQANDLSNQATEVTSDWNTKK